MVCSVRRSSRSCRKSPQPSHMTQAWTLTIPSYSGLHSHLCNTALPVWLKFCRLMVVEGLSHISPWNQNLSQENLLILGLKSGLPLWAQWSPSKLFLAPSETGQITTGPLKSWCCKMGFWCHVNIYLILVHFLHCYGLSNKFLAIWNKWDKMSVQRSQRDKTKMGL